MLKLNPYNMAATTLPPPLPLPLPSIPVALDNLPSLHAFYMRSHQAPVNWAIHAVTVPALKVSILLLLAVATAGPDTACSGTSPTASAHHRRTRLLPSADAGLAAAVAYVAYYTALSPAAGAFAAAVFGAEWLAARAVLATAGRRRAAVAGVAGVAATQVVMMAGHGGWERSPQAIVAAPAAALAAAPLCMQLDVAVWAGWLPRVAAELAAAAAAP